MPAPSPVSLRRPLAGRTEELEELLAGLDDARRGRGRVFLVAGDVGIGKTRLVEELAATTEPTEVVTLWGRCWDGAGTPPFWPFLQVLRGLVAGAPGPTLRRLLGTAAPDIARIVPELTRVLPRLEARAASVAPDARLRLFDAVTQTLGRAAAEAGGLVVALDDLHAADEPSLLLLRHLAREVCRSHLLVVGTYRDAEVRAAPSLHRLLAEIGRMDSRITLCGLEEQAVAALLEQEWGQVATPRLIHDVHQATDGNPFFVKEVARLVSTRSAINVSGPHLAVPFPEELRGAVARTLTTVPDDIRTVLASASVLGREFDLGLLARLTGLASEPLLDLLEAARSAGVVEEVTVGRWTFSHALFRESLYEELSASHRAHAHRRAGEALEELMGADAPERLPELAHHWFESACLGEVEKAVRYLDAAAGQAASGMAFEEAAALWTRALECLARSGPVDEARRAEILIALTDARQRAGDYPGARDSYHRALKAARAAGSPELFARAAVCLPSNAYGRVDSVRLGAMEEAFATLSGADVALRSLVMVELAAAVNLRTRAEDDPAWKQGWRGWQRSEDRSLELLDAALALARSADGQAIAGLLLRWLTIASVFDPPVGDASVAEELVRRFRDLGDPDSEARARFFVIRRLLLEGRVACMRVELDRFEQQAGALRLPHLVAYAASARAALALLEGRLHDAEALARAAYALGERSGLGEAELHFQRRSEVILWLQGRFTELAELARRKARRLPQAMKVECSRVALAAALAGRPETEEEGRVLFRDMVSNGLEPEVFGAPRSCCLVTLADLCWTLADLHGAAPLYDRLLPFRGSVAVTGVSTPRGATDRYLGQLSAILGRYADAERHFDEGHRRHEAMGARLWLALGWTDHARMLGMRAGAGDETRARQLLADALTVFAELGAGFQQRRVRTMLEAAPREPMPSPERSAIVHQGEFWTVLHEGRHIRLRDGKGVRYLAQLLSHPGREFHSLELAPGDATVGPGGRVENARPGGKGRRPGCDAERARQSVTKAVRSTIERIADTHPTLGAHLVATVRTGMFHAYEPDGRAPIVWER